MTVRSLAGHRTAVAEALPPGPVLDVLLGDTAGATIAEDLVASASMPAVPIAARDGYAVLSADAVDAHPDSPVSLPVSHDVSFDSRAPRRHVPRAAARIPSGAPVPLGADAVVALADTDQGVARVGIRRAVQPGDGVRPAGFDAVAGDVIVRAGTRIGPRQIAVAAALGRSRLHVRPVPRVVIMAVGDELIEPGAVRPGGGVPESTTHMLAALVLEAGAKPYRVGAVPDDPLRLRATLEDQLVRADVVITTGGLSDGVHDTVADVLARMGGFEAVDLQLRPVGRHGLGSIAAGDRDIPVIALPGSPAGAALAFEAYVRQALRVLCGHPDVERPVFRARVRTRWIVPPGVVTAMPVVVDSDDSDLPAVTPVGADALALTDLARADALVWSGPDAGVIHPGDVVECTSWGG
ncbi:molybdopterin molybdotransferase MoeA [Demequina muriae]|uniref:Molybdopterin molybdenumtransferase n=1 Tax=Demequina muriae TaxID=3051664 RepID=A0ABT8GFG3_9MICO|nr:gephyrin-like molybdotransferase Glp [Demequina sp. EGI L300058]MDN4480099.1 molybdopterin molybdotransferase MoeA [Demequina sp. EGI L300058]